MHACGPGPIPAISTTFTPRNGPVPDPSSTPMRPIMTEVELGFWPLLVGPKPPTHRAKPPNSTARGEDPAEELAGALLAG